MRPLTAGTLAAAVLGGLVAASAGAQGKAGAGKTPAPKVVRRDEILKTKPAREFPQMLRSWDLDVGRAAAGRLHELQGTLPKHVHPDAEEKIIVLEGEIRMEVGTQELTLKPGDYVSIPRGAPHKVMLPPGQTRALVVGFHIPPADAEKTIWIEPLPSAK